MVGGSAGRTRFGIEATPIGGSRSIPGRPSAAMADSRGPATAGGTTVVQSGARQPGRGGAAVVATAKPLRASAHISVHAADRRLACKQSLLAKDGRASWHEFRNACVALVADGL